MFNGISEVFVNYFLKMDIPKVFVCYEHGLVHCMFWLTLFIGLRVRDGIVTMDRNCATCSTRCGVQIYDAL